MRINRLAFGQFCIYARRLGSVQWICVLPAVCCWTVLCYKCVPTTRTRGSTRRSTMPVVLEACSGFAYCPLHAVGQSCVIWETSRPCRTLFGYCPPPALGSRKADMKTLSFFFPTPYPWHVARKQLSSPDIMGGRAACALHPFLLCPDHDEGWVRWRTLLIPTNTSK